MDNRGVILLNKDFSMEWLPIFKECGINKVGLHSLYRYGGMDGHLNWLLREETQRAIVVFEENGITVEHELHAVDWLLPRSMFKIHPEWFRMNEHGERTGDWNFCAGSREALEFIETSAYQLAVLLRQKSHNYYIWSDDCPNSVCCCAHCRNLSGADQNMIAMKHILKGLKRYDGQAKLSFLSYQDSLAVPTVAPDKDMFLEFAPIGRNHFAPISGDDEKNVKNRKILENLLKIFPADTAQVLEYFLDVSLFCQWKRENAGPLQLDEARLRADIAYYRSLGIKSVTTFSGFMDRDWLARYGTKDIELYGKVLKEF